MAKRELKFVAKFQSDIKGLKPIENKLKELGNIKLTDLSKGLKEPEKALKDIQEKAVQLQGILKRSFNTDLGTLNFKKFNEELNKANLSIKDFSKSFANAGEKGQESLMSLNSLLTNTTKIAKQGGQVIENIWKTFANAAKWSIAYGFINKIADGIRSSYEFTKDLESSLNNIRVVTGKSSEDMEKFARQANTAASNLGKTTKEYTKASLLFYQQGLSDKDVAARTNVTLKAANVTGQDTQAVSQQLTAIWNGYKVSAEEAELYIDKVAAVAATTASNLEELSEGMSKVASAASTMGVDIDELNAQLSTIISVTRQDAATAGTALKTIYARMTDIESGLDTETTLGEYTAKMAQFGIQVLDSKGALRDVGDVMQEIGDKWDGFTKTQQVALAQAMAGTRQYNNLMALFGNWDMYTKSLETSRDAMGTLQNQQDIYMESLEGHLAQLQAAGEKVYLALFDSDSFKSILEFLTNLIDKLAFVIDSLGGIGPIATAVGGILIQVFSSQLATGITNVVTNLQNFKKNTEENKNALKVLSDVIKSNAIPELGQMEDITAVLRRKGIVTEEEKNELVGYVSRLNDVKQALDEIKQRKEELAEEKVNLEKEIQVSEAEEQRSFDDFLKMGNNDLSRPLKGFSLDMPIEEAQKYEEAISNIEETYSRAETMTDNFFESVEKLNAAFNKGETIDQNSTVFKRYQETYSNLEENIRIYQKSLERLGDNEAAASLRKTKTELEGIREAFNKAAKSKNGLGKEQMVALYKQVAELNKEVDKVQVRIDKAVDTAKRKLKGEAGSDSSEIKEKKEALEAANKEAEELEKKEADIGEEGERVKVKLKDMLNSKEMQAGAQELTKITGALTQGVALVQMGAGVVKTLTDDSKSAGDKVKAILTTAITMLPMVISLVMTLATANWAAMAPLLPVVGIILGVIAAIAILTLAVKSIADAFNKEEKALDKANDSLKKQTELYNDAKNAYEELKSSIENYKNAQKAIDEMVQGTQEWKDAIQEANEQVLDLMNTYPELASKIKSETVDGVTRLTVDESGLDELETAKKKQTNSALVQRIQAQKDVRDAEKTLSAKNLNKNLGIGQGEEAFWQIGWYGFINPLAFLGASANQANAQQKATGKTQEALEKIADEYSQRGESVFLENNLNKILGDEFKELKGVIKENTEAIQENVMAITSKKEADDVANKAIMRAFLEGNSQQYNQASDVAKDAMVGTAAAIYDTLYKKYQKEYEDKGTFGNGKTDAEIQEEYRELIGADKARDKSGNVGEYLINGEWVTVSDAIARNALAQDKAGKEAANLNFSTIIPFFDNLEKSFKNEAIGQKISSALAAMGGGAEEISLETLSRKELENLRALGFSLTEKEAKALGYKDAKTAETAVTDSITKTLALWGNATSGIKNNVNRVNFEQLFENSNINLNAYKKFADQLGAVQEGIQGKIINSLFGASDQTVKNQILTALSGVDWQKDGFFAKDKFKQLLAAEGFDFQNVENLNLVNFLANSLFNQLSDPDSWGLDTIDEYINKINDVSKSLKQMGDAIDKDKFENLHQDLKELFIELEDGTHVLGASKLAFEERKKAEIESIKTDLASRFDLNKRNIFTEQERKEIQKNLNEAQDKVNKYEEIILPNTKKEVVATGFTDGYYGTKEVEKSIFEKVEDLQQAGIIENVPENVEKALRVYHSPAMNANPAAYEKELIDFYNKSLEAFEENKNHYVNLVQIYTKQLAELDPEKITTEDANAISKLYKHAYSQEDLDRIEQLIGMFTGWTDEQKKQFKEDKTNAENYINYNNYMREVSLVQNEATIAIESLNKALEKQNEILSALQKAAKSLALTEEQLAENLNEQIQAANKTIQENEKLLDFYSTNGAYKENLGKQLSTFTLGSEAEGSINELFESVSSGNLSSTLTDLLTIVYDSVQDASQADSVYNSLKEIFVNEASRETEYAKTKGALIDAAAAAAELEVQKLRNISENFTKILGFEKEVNEFLRKIAEKNKDYATIDQTYAADYMVAKEQYDVYATAVLNEQARIDELKSKEILSLQESAELKELENKIIEDQKNLQDSILSGLESVQKVEEARLELGQKINEQYERQIKNAENFISVINYQIKLAKILNGEKAYGSFYENYNNILAQRQDQRELAISKYNEAWTTYNALGPNESDEIREKALNDIVETGKAALTSIEQTLDAAKEAFEYNIKAALNTVADIAAAEAGINNYNWQYDFDTNHMSGLIRDLQLSNLGIKYQKAINQYAADESAQKRLLSIYQEVNKVLEKKETITKNDIALAEKRLALEQARIDLENAQNDTSKMKLVRGANGEYSYQYIADENNILDKLAAYNNAQLSYQEQIRSSVKDVSGEVTKLIDLFNQLAITESDAEREEIWSRINQQISALKDTTEGLDLTVLPQSVQEFIMRWTTGGLASMEELRDECDGIAKGYEQIKNDMQEISKFLIGSEESKDGSLIYAMSLVQEDAEILQFTLESMKSAFDDKKDGLLTKVAQFKTDLENAIDTVQLKASSLIATLNTKISGIVIEPSGAGSSGGTTGDSGGVIGNNGVSLDRGAVLEQVLSNLRYNGKTYSYWVYKANQIGLDTDAGQGMYSRATHLLDKANNLVNQYINLPGITTAQDVVDAIKKLSDSTKN